LGIILALKPYKTQAQFIPQNSNQNTNISCLNEPKFISSDMENILQSATPSYIAVPIIAHVVISKNNRASLYISNLTGTMSTSIPLHNLMASFYHLTQADVEIVSTSLNGAKVVVVIGALHTSPPVPGLLPGPGDRCFIFDFDVQFNPTIGLLSVVQGNATNAITGTLGSCRDPQIDGIPNEAFVVSYTYNDENFIKDVCYNYYTCTPTIALQNVVNVTQTTMGIDYSSADIALTQNTINGHYFVNMVYIDKTNLLVSEVQGDYTINPNFLAPTMQIPITGAFSSGFPDGVKSRVSAPEFTSQFFNTEFAITYSESDNHIISPAINYVHSDFVFNGINMASGVLNSNTYSFAGFEFLHDNPEILWTNFNDDAVVGWGVNYLRNGLPEHFVVSSQMPYKTPDYSKNYIVSPLYFGSPINPHFQGAAISLAAVSLPNSPWYANGNANGAYIASHIYSDENKIYWSTNTSTAPFPYKFSPNLQDAGIEDKLTISPNPAFSEITIKSKTSNGKIEIIDCTGKCVRSQLVSNRETVMNIAKLINGYYLVNHYSDGIINSESLIIKH
jgi:hypothetical protein